MKIIETPILSEDLKSLVEKANLVYLDNFNSEVWFGRCIFLSWYCERGTCDFCFRSVSSKKIKDKMKARRSLASVVAEAMLIKGLDWRIEFLTGGYGILDESEILRIAKLVSQILDDKIWINLGEVGSTQLEEFEPYVGGIVSSIETVEEKLHNKVCPDKPIKPYVKMMSKAHLMGYKLSMTVVIGLGEKKEDFSLLSDFIIANKIDRITIYALRPVAGTPYTQGPSPEDVVWWVAKTRIAFPKLEIIVGTARFRIPEISLMIKAGANAITKLPATNIFNTEDGAKVVSEVEKTGRKFISKFSSKDVYSEANWEGMLDRLDATSDEKILIRKKLHEYLETIDSRVER